MWNPSDYTLVGRGAVQWNSAIVDVKEAWLVHNKSMNQAYEISFEAQNPKEADQVQIWAGFGFKDRDNRYVLGLRGGNNDDLYLCRYRSGARNKMLALESLPHHLETGKWNAIKMVVWDKHIQVYLNQDSIPTLTVTDSELLMEGNPYLGGGWINTTFRHLVIKKLDDKSINEYSNRSKKETIPSLIYKEKQRQIQRKQYRPTIITKLNSGRTEISLDGNWLFLPDNESKDSFDFSAENKDDLAWHVMSVPNFWNPVRNWLYLQDSHFPHKGSGISDNYREKEENRCNQYTFDSEKTKSAWYRHYIVLPKEIKEKRLVLHFDAVAKVAKVFLNGHLVGHHIGMFGEFEFDITPFVHSGKNTIAVNVQARKEEKKEEADTAIAKAVSVSVTNDMVNSLPFGMFEGREGGIWQSVKLIVTKQTYLKEVFANVNTTGGVFEITINSNLPLPTNGQLQLEISNQKSNKLFYTQSVPVSIRSGSFKTAITLERLSPDLWTPETPNLYTWKTKLYIGKTLVDIKNVTIGFRTFVAKGNQFLLNGIPYWIRGANHPPAGIAPNDSLLANQFMKLMHDGNQMFTRSHGCPFTEAWMQAADKQGVGVSFEGSWPWLMIGNIPSDELLQLWKEETLALVRKYRNHPSLLIWTMNNEMYFTMFYHNDPPEIRIKKWKIISDIIKEIRTLLPNTPISADSGYSRVEEDYTQNLEPNQIDDGDIDDRHIYFNWYNTDFFQIKNGEWDKRIYWSPGANANRPFFSQETSTGYTNNDDGHFNRKYLFNNYVPQAWVGDWAYEDRDPKYTLKRHAFLTKELLETIRRTGFQSAGVLLFANTCWFQDVFDASKIKPYPVYQSVKKAAQPILVSAELFGRNFYSGTTFTPSVHIINNAVNGKTIPPSVLEWELKYGNTSVSTGKCAVDSVSFYTQKSVLLPIKIPLHLPEKKAEYQLLFQLKTNKDILSQNSYDLIIVEKKQLTNPIANTKKIGVFDLTGETYRALDSLKINCLKLKDLTQIRTEPLDLLIVANIDSDSEVPYNWEDVANVNSNGLPVLLLHPGKHLQWLFYDKIASVYEQKGRIVNMHIPEHPAFSEIDPMELAWWQAKEKEIPVVCRRSFRLKNQTDMVQLCTYLRPHTDLGSDPPAYLEEMSGCPLLEIKNKKGVLIASELELNQAIVDPIAATVFNNIIGFLLTQSLK